MALSIYTVTVDAIALVAATAKSIFEIGTASTNRAKIKEWWVDFDGVTASAVPVKVEVQRFSAAVTTATTITPDPIDGAEAAESTCKHSTSTEGAGTATAGSGWIKRIPPTSGFHYIAVEGRELLIPVSAFFRIRCTAAAGVNVSFGFVFEE
jgi:hypothetical protein